MIFFNEKPIKMFDKDQLRLFKLILEIIHTSVINKNLIAK